MWLGVILRAVTGIMETIVTGRGQGATKKELAIPIAQEVMRALAQAGVIPAALPVDEIGDEIDNIVAEQNKGGWVGLISGSKFYLSVAELIELIKASKSSV